jgi:hypothetical protein
LGGLPCSCLIRHSHQGSRWAGAQAARPNLARRSAPRCRA